MLLLLLLLSDSLIDTTVHTLSVKPLFWTLIRDNRPSFNTFLLTVVSVGLNFTSRSKK